MENTSFIPKQMQSGRQVVKRRSHVKSSPSGNIFLVLASVIFIATLVGAGGLKYMLKLKSNEIADTNRNISSLNSNDAEIKKLQEKQKRVQAVRQALDNHLYSSRIFEAIGRLTEKNVQLTDFSYGFGEAASSDNGDGTASNASVSGIQVSLSGNTKSLKKLVSQIDALKKVDLLEKNNLVYIVSAKFSDVKESDDGTVDFSLDLILDEDTVRGPKVAQEKVGDTDNNQ